VNVRELKALLETVDPELEIEFATDEYDAEFVDAFIQGESLILTRDFVHNGLAGGNRPEFCSECRANVTRWHHHFDCPTLFEYCSRGHQLRKDDPKKDEHFKVCHLLP
jgi:hypothetical protein